MIGFYFGQTVFFFAKRRRKANDRDRCLDLTGAVDAVVMFWGNTHGAARERPMGIHGAAPFLVECRAGQILKLFRELVREMIRPVIQHRRCGKARKAGLDSGDLIPGYLLDGPALRVGKTSESFQEILSIQDGDGKRADAATAASLTAGHLFEQRRRRPVKPA